MSDERLRKAYKYKLKPTPEQERASLSTSCGAVACSITRR